MINFKALVIALTILAVPFASFASDKKHPVNNTAPAQGVGKAAPMGASTTQAVPNANAEEEEEGHEAGHQHGSQPHKM